MGLIKPTYHPGSLEEFIRLLPDGIGVIPLFLGKGIQHGTLAEFEKAIEAYEGKVAELAELGVSLIHAEGAPPFMTRGFRGEQELTDQWARHYGVPVSTSGQTQIEALRALGVTKVVGVTYTSGETNEVVSRYFAEAGIQLLVLAPVKVDFHRRGYISHVEVYELAKHLYLQHQGAEGILLFGSGWRSLPAISLLEQDLQIPVVHAVTARVWAVQRRLLVRQSIGGYGRLLQDLP